MISSVDTHKILIVQTAYAGDVVLVTPLIRATADYFHGAEIHVLVIPQTAGLLAHNPEIHKVWIYDKRRSEKGGGAFWDWARKLRAERFDLALVPHRSLRSAALVRAAGISARVGFDRSAGRWLLNRIVPYPKNRHEVDRNLTLLSALGWQGEPPAPQLFPSDAERKNVQTFLNEMQLTETPLLAMAPGSVWATKRWLPERFAEVAARLYAERKIKTVLIGGPEDALPGQKIREMAGESVVDAIGRFSLLESAELIRRCRAALTNDSAPCHLAVSVGTPVSAIFGPTIPAFGFAPYGPRNQIVEITDLACRPCSIHGTKKCPKKHFLCMKQITADEVIKALNPFLD
jgi:heptosyltransferase-2